MELYLEHAEPTAATKNEENDEEIEDNSSEDYHMSSLREQLNSLIASIKGFQDLSNDELRLRTGK